LSSHALGSVPCDAVVVVDGDDDEDVVKKAAPTRDRNLFPLLLETVWMRSTNQISDVSVGFCDSPQQSREGRQIRTFLRTLQGGALERVQHPIA